MYLKGSLLYLDVVEQRGRSFWYYILNQEWTEQEQLLDLRVGSDDFAIVRTPLESPIELERLIFGSVLYTQLTIPSMRVAMSIRRDMNPVFVTSRGSYRTQFKKLTNPHLIAIGALC